MLETPICHIHLLPLSRSIRPLTTLHVRLYPNPRFFTTGDYLVNVSRCPIPSGTTLKGGLMVGPEWAHSVEDGLDDKAHKHIIFA